jgi:hypothetical protein
MSTVITADIRDPAGILDNPELGALIDFSQPIGVLFVAIFHFIRDSEDPSGLLAAFRERLAPGSHLVLSHLTTDGPDTGEVEQVVDVYKNATSPIVFRPRREITGFFDGFELIDPGITRPWQWRPEYGVEGPQTDWLFAGVGRLENAENDG